MPRGQRTTVAASQSRESLALAVSLLVHPFVISPVTVLLLTDVRSSLLLVLVVSVPLLILIVKNVRSGTWTNYDVSVRTQRSGLYWPAFVLTGVLALILWRSGTNPGLMKGTVVAVCMIATAMLINRWLKVSLHMMFGAFCAVILAWRYPAVTIPLGLALALLAWSRLTLKRHTWPEVYVGAIVGCAGGAWLILM